LIALATEKHETAIVAIYAGGSFAREDFVPGRSDVDIYFIVKDNNEELENSLGQIAKKVERKHFHNLRSTLGEVLSIAVTSLDDIQPGRSFLAAGFEYSDFMDTGRLLWGTDIKPLIPAPSPETQRESAQLYLGRIYEMASEVEKSYRWFGWIPLRVLGRSSKEKWTREAFNFTFRTLAVYLGSKGVYASRKEDIMGRFQKICANQIDLCGIASFASSMWEKWKTNALSDKETKQLIKNSFILARGLRKADSAGEARN
jgi:predicted nucleotidyltransferase